MSIHTPGLTDNIIVGTSVGDLEYLESTATVLTGVTAQ